MGERDVTVLPRETSHFGFFKYGTDDELLPMDQTEVYVNDQLGLKQMNEAGKIKFYTHNTLRCVAGCCDALILLY